jgi:flagellar export protein FliJ
VTSRKSRLDTVLRVRRIQEEISRGRLAGEVLAERRAQEALAQAQARYAAPTVALMDAPGTAQVFIATQRHQGALAGSVLAAGTGADTAAQVTVVARHEWSEAAIRMTALERLEDRARESARTERLATEQRTSDESSSARQRSLPVTLSQGKRP